MQRFERQGTERVLGAEHIRASLRRASNARLKLILKECEQERARPEARKWGHGLRRGLVRAGAKGTWTLTNPRGEGTDAWVSGFGEWCQC